MNQRRLITNSRDVIGWGIGALQVFFVCSLLLKQIVPTPTSEYTGTQQDYYGNSETTHLYSYRTLQNFNGFAFVSTQQQVGGAWAGASSRASLGGPNKLQDMELLLIY